MGDKLLLATNNQGKVREYKSLLQNLPLELVTLAEKGITTVVDEVGESLEENARLKAILLAAESQLLALADDSGLEVGALGGEPGRLSARYAGEGASDRDIVTAEECTMGEALGPFPVCYCGGYTQRRGEALLRRVSGFYHF